MNESKADLMRIPGVGKSIADDLLALGYHAVSELRNENPLDMYDALCKLTKSKQDRCVLYVFRCAVYFADTKNPEPELLKWWNWKDKS